MKIRNGFVSNSSSSSFIVAAEKDKTDIIISISVDLETYGEILDSKEKLDDYFQSEWGRDDYSNVEDNLDTDSLITYQSCLEEIKEGKIIIVGMFTSDSEDDIERFMCMQGIPKDAEGIKIIKNNGGY